jgi:hypothetical protein
MTTTVKEIEIDSNENKWFEISGMDYGTGIDFGDSEVFGVTCDGVIMDCDGFPITNGDYLDVAVKNALNI